MGCSRMGVSVTYLLLFGLLMSFGLLVAMLSTSSWLLLSKTGLCGYAVSKCGCMAVPVSDYKSFGVASGGTFRVLHLGVCSFSNFLLEPNSKRNRCPRCISNLSAFVLPLGPSLVDSLPSSVLVLLS